MQGARGRMDGTSQRRPIHVVVIPDLISLAYLQPFDTLAALSVSPNVKLFKYCRLFHHSVMQVKVYNAAGNVII